MVDKTRRFCQSYRMNYADDPPVDCVARYIASISQKHTQKGASVRSVPHSCYLVTIPTRNLVFSWQSPQETWPSGQPILSAATRSKSSNSLRKNMRKVRPLINDKLKPKRTLSILQWSRSWMWWKAVPRIYLSAN